ncbi:uncharacterized protein Z519_10576 [Cladophialophora bantiana CBS 173.52]|uniref:NB-ARC domain-containing protein n=1 Tax=Cladophialophora bantiana (strain ATCC 10958 / CBS 173.52 / CDC B-1940 / NIH 8579) TaxID=1442370 RepID=A0A0D2EGC5_CLAB1|nr:uncharacterized protein Z519_10576 [Cladophialophora bantiana CBS 173.52]KIW89091.1 hypothetical protein Z519_10576 [Cladophialophora bantiana CBS 173.52]
MSSSAGKQIVQYGLTEVFSVADPLVDVVFVHGLNGHPHETWSTKKPNVFWPADLLPTALNEQRPRILTYGYDANVTAFTDGVSKDKIHNHAEHLASRLVANRSLRKATERPIIFVCHSLGGLVVKRCLIYCQSIRHHQHTERLRSIYISTYGILFLGTPHNGSDLAKWGSLLEKICAVALPKKFFDTSPQLVHALQTNNETLQNINRLFIEIIGRFHIYFFHESKPTDLKGTRVFVVEEDSAAPVFEGVERTGIEKDHSHMCKFENESSPGYDVVAEAIQRYAIGAQSLIRSRWEEEKRVAEFEKQAAARELLGDSIFQRSAGASGTVTPSTGIAQTSQSNPMSAPPPKQISASASPPYEVEEVDEDFVTAPQDSTSSIRMIEQSLAYSSTSLVVAPVGFRPNSIFLGFQLEMDQLVQKLANQKRRALGTCAVLLWGPPGCGKSQIAREYLWRHRSEYPAGCFWVDSKTKESRSKSFWDIAQAVAILGKDEPRDPGWDESSRFVDTVRKWFETREGWLLIFDGVTTDNDDDIEAFVSYIPDRSGNNIIYTSVDRTLAKRQRLLNPAGVKVFPLSQHDACALLYKNLGIRSPNETQVKKATQLVKHYECLPLAVHAAAHALIARGTSLEKFSPGTSDHRLADPYLDIISALREHSHPEAVNLVTVLSFFAHVIPVALIRFGQPALQEFGVEIRSIEQIGSLKKELDNTIAVLIRYGLVERTLQEYCVTPSKASFAPEESERTRANSNGTVGTARTTAEMERLEPRLLKDDSSSLEGLVEAHADSKLDGSSSQSVTYSIDILRIHSVVQNVLRDELKLRYADQPAHYWWWLCVASKMLCHSYTVADGKIKSTDGRGLVRDYRDYETQAARLWSHFPKSSSDASPTLRKTRHNLHETIRSIKKEIQSQSPSQSIDSLHHRVQFSVFERASSTSSDSPGTESSALTRTSTWTPEHTDDQTESPIQLHLGLNLDDEESEGSWTDRWSQSGMDNSKVLIPSTNRSRRPSNSDMYTITPTEASFGTTRQSSVLQAIFQGRPAQSKSPRDLGEWKPMPVPPTVSHEQAQIQSRASSFTSGSDDRTARPTSTGSEASGALAAIHRASPPPTRGGRIKSPTRLQCTRPTSDEGRVPLSIRSPNQKISPLTTEFLPSLSLPTYDSSEMSRRHSRHPSSSPRLMQTTLNNQAVTRIVPSSSGDENFSLPQPPKFSGMQPRLKHVPAQEGDGRLSAKSARTGYSSQPMSRDTSRDSNTSHATAPPAVPGSASLSTSPQIREPYLYSRPGLASIDVATANLWDDELAAVGDLGNISPLASSISFNGGDIFERDHERLGSSVQFGQMSPVELDRARARVSLARGRSMDGRLQKSNSERAIPEVDRI